MWWCSKQEETGCKVLLKNLAGKKRIIIKKLVILQDLEEMVLTKTQYVFRMREKILEQAGQ